MRSLGLSFKLVLPSLSLTNFIDAFSPIPFRHNLKPGLSLKETIIPGAKAFDLVIDTCANVHSTDETKVYYIDTALVTDVLLEVFGAQTVVASKHSDDESDDIFDEPDVDYDQSNNHETKNALSLLPQSSLSSSRPRHLWTNAKIVARMTLAENENVTIENKASSIIEGLEDMLLDDDAFQLSLQYRIEDVNLMDEYTTDWCDEVQSNWPPSILVSNDLNLGPPIIASLYFHTIEDCNKVIDENEKYDRIILEGGSAFGTGDHPTAKLCSEWLLRNCLKNEPEEMRLMDYGSGSGLLGLVALIAAKRYGTKLRVEGVEVDPVAIDAARRNCALNGYNDTSQIEFFAPMKGAPGSKEWDEVTGVLTGEAADPLPFDRNGYYDILIANIVARPLISLAPTLSKLTKARTGKLALCGLQTCDINAVIDAYTLYYDMRIVHSLDDWVLLEGISKP